MSSNSDGSTPSGTGEMVSDRQISAPQSVDRTSSFTGLILGNHSGSNLTNGLSFPRSRTKPEPDACTVPVWTQTSSSPFRSFPQMMRARCLPTISNRVRPISRVFDDDNNEKSLSGEFRYRCGGRLAKPFQNNTRSCLPLESDSLFGPGYWKRREEIEGDRAPHIRVEGMAMTERPKPDLTAELHRTLNNACRKWG